MTIRSIFTYEQNTVPTIDVEEGDLWLNPDTQAVSQYTNSVWTNMNLLLPAQLGRGVFGGGFNPSASKIDYIAISTLGNATSFGTLALARYYLGAASNGTSSRGVFGGGTNDGSNPVNIIDYITISTPGNATAFGLLTSYRQGVTANCNGTGNRAVFAGGTTDGGSAGLVRTMDYITVSTTGNAQAFGILTLARQYLSATSNGTSNRGVFGGGSGPVNNLDYITINATSDAAIFGQLTAGRYWLGATSNGTSNRGVFGGGTNPTTNIIDYITISTTGNATSFGQLTITRYGLTATSNGTSDRGVFGGGYYTGGLTDTMDYITISTNGNATTFGTLTAAIEYQAATSNA